MNGFKAPEQDRGPKQEAMEAGNYPGRLVQVMVLGLQEQRAFKGEPKAPQVDLMLTYEFADEFVVDEEGNEIEDKPRWLSETIPMHSLDADLAKSTKRYYAMDPTKQHDGDWSALVDIPVNIVITKKPGTGKNADKVYNNIASISSMRPKDAAKAPALVNEPRLFTAYSDDVDGFKALPQWLQDKIKGGLDFEGGPLDIALKGGVQKKEEKEDPVNEADESPQNNEDGDW